MDFLNSIIKSRPDHEHVLNSSILQEEVGGAQIVIIREIKEKDYEAFKSLFNQAFSEYLEFLKRENPQQYERSMKELEQPASALQSIL